MGISRRLIPTVWPACGRSVYTLLKAGEYRRGGAIDSSCVCCGFENRCTQPNPPLRLTAPGQTLDRPWASAFSFFVLAMELGCWHVVNSA
jgi:hypothetical protein